MSRAGNGCGTRRLLLMRRCARSAALASPFPFRSAAMLPPLHSSLEAYPKGYLLLLIGFVLEFLQIIPPFCALVKGNAEKSRYFSLAAAFAAASCFLFYKDV